VVGASQKSHHLDSRCHLAVSFVTFGEACIAALHSFSNQNFRAYDEASSGWEASNDGRALRRLSSSIQIFSAKRQRRQAAWTSPRVQALVS
jgi:hypothetical protein